MLSFSSALNYRSMQEEDNTKRPSQSVKGDHLIEVTA